MLKKILPLFLLGACSFPGSSTEVAGTTTLKLFTLDPQATPVSQVGRVTVDGKEIPQKTGTEPTSLGWSLANGDLTLPTIDVTNPRLVALTIGDQQVELTLDLETASASRDSGSFKLQALLYKENGRLAGADLLPMGTDDNQRIGYLKKRWPIMDLNLGTIRGQIKRLEVGPWVLPTDAIMVTGEGDAYLPPYALIEAGGANAHVCMAVTNPQLQINQLLQLELTKDFGDVAAPTGAITPATMPQTLTTSDFAVKVPLTEQRRVTDLNSPLCP